MVDAGERLSERVVARFDRLEVVDEQRGAEALRQLGEAEAPAVELAPPALEGIRQPRPRQ
jgi:hypothetical protein